MTNPSAPGAVSADRGLWDLRASPDTLEAAARAWRELRDAADTAETTVRSAARRVLEGDGWRGDTAESYDNHRRKVTTDLQTSLSDRTVRIAETLEEVASMLRVNQEVLDGEWQRVAGVPATYDPELTFHPEDDEQMRAVTDAIKAANEIRTRVDEQLANKLGALESAQTHFTELAETWQPRTVGMLNLNIGQGYKNEPRNSAGTDHGDMGEIAQVIADEDVDVVTMQEMFGQDADDLERELRERTGDEWTVYFGEASEKPYWSDGFRPRGFNEPFGNAIAVRHGGNVETSEYVDTHKLDVPGSHVEPPTIPSPQTPPGPDDPPPSAGVTDGEGRSAIEVELTLGGGG